MPSSEIVELVNKNKNLEVPRKIWKLTPPPSPPEISHEFLPGILAIEGTSPRAVKRLFVLVIEFYFDICNKES